MLLKLKFCQLTKVPVLLRGFASTEYLRNRLFMSLTRCQPGSISIISFHKRSCGPIRTSFSQLLFNESKRSFWGITVAFNQVDEERVKLAGPDRAAAEWVLRNEGAIQWADSNTQLNDYNLLPRTDFEAYKLEELDLSNTKVIGLGFDHLKGLKHVRKIKLHNCLTIMDDALERLEYVKESLEHLEITSCPMITDAGLNHLTKLIKLKTLILHNLEDVPDLTKTVNRLKISMPWCNIKSEL
ncbi:ATP synthase subunit s, mitochondrial [Bulinus truncatus]|nr:ATP synthase subunit s, mitochondrial [Bulinus truncatus]